MGICGLIINAYFYQQILQKYHLSRWMQHFSDVFGHLLPLILMYFYAPRKTDLTFPAMLLIYLVLSVGYFFIVGNPAEVYVGVPAPVLFLLPPAVLLLATYFRFFSPQVRISFRD